MADTTMGASAPSTTPALRRVITSTLRSRRNHGVFLLGHHVAGIYSWRREGHGCGVSMSVGHGLLMLTGSMSPTQARAMAYALHAAANAAELVGGDHV